MKRLAKLLMAVSLCNAGFATAQTELHLMNSNYDDSNHTHQVVWNTEPGVQYELQSGSSLTNMGEVSGFPTQAVQYADAYAFNTTSNQSQFFKVLSYDEQPPAITNRVPNDGAFAIRRFSPIQIDLADVSGIDPDRIALSVGSLGTFAVSETQLTFTNNTLIFDNGGDTALGDYGSNVTVSLVVADVNGYAATNTWAFDLEVEPVVASNLFVFGSPDAQRSGQLIGAIPTRALADRMSTGPIRMNGNAASWELQSVETNALIISYTGTNAPIFEVGTKLANLTPINIDDFFYRSIASISDDSVNQLLTLFTDELLLTDVLEDGSLSDLSDSFVLEVAEDGAIQRADSFVGSASLPPAGFSLDGSHFKVAENGWEVKVGPVTYTDGSLDGIGLELTAEEFHWWLYPKLETALEIQGASLKRFSSIAKGHIDSALVCSSTISSGISYDKTIFDLPTHKEPSFYIIPTIGGVPVRIDVSVDMKVDLDASADVALQTRFGIRQNFDAAFGMHYEDGEVDWIKTFAAAPTEVIPFDTSISSELGLGLTLKPRVSVLIYKCAGMATGPSIRGGASIRMDETELSGWLEGSASWDIETTGPLLDFLNIHKSLSFSIWEDEWKVFPESSNLQITTQPNSLVTELGNAAYFSCSASADQIISYQWFHNETVLPGENFKTLLIPRVKYDRAGQYHVAVSAGGESKLTSIAVLSVTSSDINLGNGLVAYYPFDGSAKDKSGNGLHGTVFGSIPATDRIGQSGHCYSFRGRGSYISTPDVGNMDAVTISTWVYNNFTSGEAGEDDRTVFSTRRSNANNELTLQWDADAEGINGVLKAGYYDDSSSWFSLDSGLGYEAPEWRHLAVTYGGGALRLYIDGEFTGQKNVDWNLDDFGNWTFGRRQVNNHDYDYFKGNIDEVRIYNRALTANEIAALAGRYLSPDDADNSRYHVIAGNFSWDEAKADAEARGGHLATITSSSENAIIADKLISTGVADAWIGATDAAIEGEWKWVVGPESSTQFWQGDSSGASLGYQNWDRPEQPSTPQYSGEDYALITSTGKWWDANIGRNAVGVGTSYVLEIEVASP